MATLSLPLLGLVVIGVYTGGVVKGIAGFGYAIASTAILATLMAPDTAVVLLIVPLLVANITLLGELQLAELQRCLARFWSYVLMAMAGTVLGMLLLADIPTAMLTLGLGAFTLLYVFAKQPWYQIPGTGRVLDYCFTPETGSKVALGFLSGVIFGLTNVAVQVVAYLDSLELDRSTFVGVLAMILVGIAGVRVGIAWTLGMYHSGGLVLYSGLLSIPGLVGVESGRRLRSVIPGSYEHTGVLVLLSLIGIRLVSKGLSP